MKIFLVLLGSLVVVVTRSGGSYLYHCTDFQLGGSGSLRGGGGGRKLL